MDLIKNNKSVVLYSPFSNIGHFDSWCIIFTKILLQNGWVVIVVSKNNKKLLLEMLLLDDAVKSRLLLLDQSSNMQTSLYLKLIECLINKLKLFQFFNIIKINITKLKDNFFKKPNI